MSQDEEVKCSITNPCNNHKVCNLDSQLCEDPHKTNLLIGNRKFIGGPILKDVIQRKYGHLFNSDTVCNYGLDIIEQKSLQGLYKELRETINDNQLLAFYDPIANNMLCQLRSDVERYWASKENLFPGIVLTEKEHNDLKKNNTLIFTYKYTKDKEYFLPIGPLAQGTFILQKQKASIKDHSFFVLIKTDSTWIDTNPPRVGAFHNYNPNRDQYGSPFYVLFPVKESIPKTRWDTERNRRTRWDVTPTIEDMKGVEIEDYKTEQSYVSQQIQLAQKILSKKINIISSANSGTFSFNQIYTPMSKIKNYWRLLLNDIKEELKIDKTRVQEYVGDRKNGVRHGRGYIIKSIKPYSAYYGEYKDNKRNGIGITEYIHNNYLQGFIGEWKNSKKNGYGYLRNVTKLDSFNLVEEWVCYWKDDKIIGDGYYQLKSSLFEGESYLYYGSWKNNFKNGKGIEFITNLYINIGNFVMSTFTGDGLRHYNSKTKQYGTFFNSVLQSGIEMNKNYFKKAFELQYKRAIKWITEIVVGNEYDAYYLSPDYQWWGAFSGNKMKWKRGKIGFDTKNSPFAKLAHTIEEMISLFPPINQVKQVLYKLGKILLIGWTEIEI